MINFSDEEKLKLTTKIQDYFYSEMDEEIGVIAAGKLLDFFMETMGNEVYNKALDEIKRWMNKKFEDMDGDYYSLYKKSTPKGRR